MILEKIIIKKIERLKYLKSVMSFDNLVDMVIVVNNDSKLSLYDSLYNSNDISIIAEIKKASPSKGIISENFQYMNFAKEYNKYADAISVLTEEDFFLGKSKYLTEIKKETQIPVLRKDFIIDEYQIYESKIMNADAILLICRILTKEQLKKYIVLSHELGLECLVEVHDESEISYAIESGATIIGINNRDLKTFKTSLNTTASLIKYIPENIVKVSESGIKTYSDIQHLKEIGVDAVLIGEAFMNTDSIRDKFIELRGSK